MFDSYQKILIFTGDNLWLYCKIKLGLQDLIKTTKKCEYQYLQGQISLAEWTRCNYDVIHLYSDTYDECACESEWCDCTPHDGETPRGVICYHDD